MRLYDLHVHTALSACAARDACIAEYCADARESGLPVIGFADHAWDKAVAGASPWYAPQDYERLLARRAEAERESGLKVLLGAEAEMAAGVVAFTPESAALLDYIICPHSHTHMKGFVLPADAEAPEKHADFLVKSFYALCVHPLARYILGVAHPMYPIGKSADEADEIYAHISDDALFFICQAAAKADLALELKKRYTIVIVTHNMQQASRISDQTAFFLLGEVIEMCDTDRMFSAPSDRRTEDYITGRFG